MGMYMAMFPALYLGYGAQYPRENATWELHRQTKKYTGMYFGCVTLKNSFFSALEFEWACNQVV